VLARRMFFYLSEVNESLGIERDCYFAE